MRCLSKHQTPAPATNGAYVYTGHLTQGLTISFHNLYISANYDFVILERERLAAGLLHKLISDGALGSDYTLQRSCSVNCG